MSILKSNNAGLIDRLVEKIKNMDPLTYDEMGYLVKGINLYKVKDAGELRILESHYRELLSLPLYTDFKKRHPNWAITLSWIDLSGLDLFKVIQTEIVGSYTKHVNAEILRTMRDLF